MSGTLSDAADARRLDADDPLRPFPDRFQLPLGLTYLDGNPPGALPRDTPKRVADVVEAEWGEGLIRLPGPRRDHLERYELGHESRLASSANGALR